MVTAAIEHEQDGRTAVNVFEIFTAQIDLQTAAQVIGDEWGASVMPELANELQCTRVLISAAVPVVYNVGVSGNGGTASATINTCYLIDKIPNAGRRGRTFLAGVTEGNVDGVGNVLAAKVASLDTAMNQFLADINAGGVELQIERVDGSSDAIDSFSCQSLASTQRRRMRR